MTEPKHYTYPASMWPELDGKKGVLRECQDTRPPEGTLLVDLAEELEHCDAFKDTPEAIQEQRMRSGGEVMVFL